MSEKRDQDTRRETRLLLLVVAVSLTVLVLLAQWRFPGADLGVVPPSAAPLAGLTARATFDEMANTLADALGRLTPSLSVVRLETRPAEPNGRPGRGRNTVTVRPPSTIRRAIVLRVARDLGLVHLTADLRPVAPGDDGAALEVVASDEAHELALVRLPAADSTDLLANGLRSFSGLSFTAVVEATPTAASIRPVFVGRVESVLDPRWSHPLLLIGPLPELGEGTFLFSVTGRLIGLTQQGAEGLVLIPAAALETVTALLASGTVNR